MKKFFSILVLSSISVVSWASPQTDKACYSFVKSQLKKGYQFRYIFPDAWKG